MPMASVSDSVSSQSSFNLSQRIDIEAIRSLVSVVNRHIRRFLADPAARKSLQLKSNAKITVANHGYFEFSEHSVLSNLYWGIESAELAVEAHCADERKHRLLNSEQMLQIPALLEEEGTTAGISNSYLVCCSYYYLAIVRKLCGDEWQMTMHFLHSLIVSSHLVRTELAPELWQSLFGTLQRTEAMEKVDEIVKQQARRYKDWLMYYQVLSYAPPIRETEISRSRNFTSRRYDNPVVEAPLQSDGYDVKIDSTLEVHENLREMNRKARAFNSAEIEIYCGSENDEALHTSYFGNSHAEIKEGFDIRCLHEMLEDSQSDTSISFYSQSEASDTEAKRQKERPREIISAAVDISPMQINERNCPPFSSAITDMVVAGLPGQENNSEADEVNGSYLLPRRSHSSLDNLKFPVLDLRNNDLHSFSKCYLEETPARRSSSREFRCFSNFSSKLRKKYSFSETVPRGGSARKKLSFSIEKDSSEHSSICFSDVAAKLDDPNLEVMTVWEILNRKIELKDSSPKQEILDQLIDIISTSKKETVIRASVRVLLVLISEDKTIIDDIRKKDIRLHDLASALKRNIHEAAILLYLLNPSPSEMKNLELLPVLVEVACNSNNHQEKLISLPLTPTTASIAMIEILVTRFDYVTNNMHLAAISSPQVISKLVNVALNKNLVEGVALAAILVRCMRLNGNCRKFLSQVTPVDPFLHLLRSNEQRDKFAALEYFQEILSMPRSSVLRLLQQVREQGGLSIMHTLMACIQQADIDHQLLAANLLLQLDMLETTRGKSVFRDEAMEVFMEAVASEHNPGVQALSASILSNLGGTYAWTGESYTAAWLVKKARLTSMYQRNLLQNIDWFDPCLQDAGIDTWRSKTARGFIKQGRTVFNALARGIKSKTRSVSRDCLVCIAWLGNEMSTSGPSNLRYFACEILLDEIANFLHPGSELDERIIACLCIYNYTAGKGKQKLINFSEGLRESLRRLSGVTWMAEELLKVTDYYLPNKPRVSCVHTQILEVSDVGSGAVTALIFYRGHLCAGYSDGSIKVWQIRGLKPVLVAEVKEHKRQVTCLALLEPGESLLSGSIDKTVRVWQMVQKKLECIEVLEMKEPVQKVDSHGDRILVVTQSRGLKVCHASRDIQTICKNKQVKCLAVSQCKFFLGCADASMQEVDAVDNHRIEIRAPAKSWKMQNKAITSVLVFKEWVYSASTIIEGARIKEWRRNSKPQVSIPMARGTNVQAMAITEDFIYLNLNSSPTIVQIWLREKQQKVGRLSAGSKMTSLLTANDFVLCGTETGFIKGWIPL